MPARGDACFSLSSASSIVSAPNGCPSAPRRAASSRNRVTPISAIGASKPRLLDHTGSRIGCQLPMIAYLNETGAAITAVSHPQRGGAKRPVAGQHWTDCRNSEAQSKMAADATGGGSGPRQRLGAQRTRERRPCSGDCLNCRLVRVGAVVSFGEAMQSGFRPAAG